MREIKLFHRFFFFFCIFRMYCISRFLRVLHFPHLFRICPHLFYVPHLLHIFAFLKIFFAYLYHFLNSTFGLPPPVSHPPQVAEYMRMRDRMNRDRVLEAEERNKDLQLQLAKTERLVRELRNQHNRQSGPSPPVSNCCTVAHIFRTPFSPPNVNTNMSVHVCVCLCVYMCGLNVHR